MAENDLAMDMIATIMNQHEMKGKITREQTAALVGICDREMSHELETAFGFINTSPDKDATLAYYQNERVQPPEIIMNRVDSQSSSMDIGTLKGVRFTPEMWQVARECHIGGHMMALDVVANYYAKRWGNPIDGTFSIDGALNKAASKGSGCAFAALVLLGGIFASTSVILVIRHL